MTEKELFVVRKKKSQSTSYLSQRIVWYILCFLLSSYPRIFQILWLLTCTTICNWIKPLRWYLIRHEFFTKKIIWWKMDESEL